MKLRTKLIIFTALTMITAILVVLLGVRLILVPNFLEAELNDAVSRTERIQGAFQAIELETLEYMLLDWSIWDDAYQFVVDRNKKFVEVNISDSTMGNLRLNALLFLDLNGKLVYGAGYDLVKKIRTPLPAQFNAQFKKLSQITRKEGTKGLISLPEGPLLFAAQPILTSNNQGPVRGTLIFGRFLNDTETNYLAKSLQLNIRVQLPGSKDLSLEKFKEIVGKSRNDLSIESIDDTTIMGYTILRDLNGEPVAVITRTVSRIIYNKLERTITVFIAIIVGVGFLLGAVILTALDRLITTRIAKLAEAIVAIGKKEKLNLTVPEEGNDEITSLQRSINATLRSLNQAQIMLFQSQQSYNAIFEDVNDIVFTANLKGEFTSINKAAKRILGYKPEDIIGRPFDFLATPDSRAVLKAKLDEKISGQQQRTSYEAAIKTKDGRVLTLEINSQVQLENGKPVAVFGIARDVTERKRFEKQLNEKVKELEEFQLLAVGRELKMTEMEKEINELLKKLGQPPKYK
ncbi:MAG: CHASE4 domain-containing protein [Candidatus Margulisiibacteriota bacterium]|jgi:PAS domain S-box-containing protein